MSNVSLCYRVGDYGPSRMVHRRNCDVEPSTCVCASGLTGGDHWLESEDGGAIPLPPSFILVGEPADSPVFKNYTLAKAVL